MPASGARAAAASTRPPKVVRVRGRAQHEPGAVDELQSAVPLADYSRCRSRCFFRGWVALAPLLSKGSGAYLRKISRGWAQIEVLALEKLGVAAWPAGCLRRVRLLCVQGACRVNGSWEEVSGGGWGVTACSIAWLTGVGPLARLALLVGCFGGSPATWHTESRDPTARVRDFHIGFFIERGRWSGDLFS